MKRVLIFSVVATATLALFAAPSAMAKKKKYDVTQTIELSVQNPPAGSRTATFTGRLTNPVCATDTGAPPCPAKVGKACSPNRTVRTLYGNSQVVSTTAPDGTFSGQASFDGDFGGQPQTLTLTSQANRVNIRSKRLKINCRQSNSSPGGAQVTFTP